MNQQIDHSPSLARRLLAILPSPVSDMLRQARRSILNTRSRADVFSRIAEKNEWDGTESVSGPGSTMAATQVLREALPALLEKYEVQSLLDVPCGDAHWIVTVLPDHITYTGGDIVPELIERVREEKGDAGNFVVLDLVTDPLPKADLVMVRDCFIHLPNATVKKAIANIKRSGAKWLLTTHFINETENLDIEIGGYRPVNLLIEPFNMPQPEALLDDFDGINVNGKHVALWRLAEL